MRCPICGSNECCGGELSEKVERLETELAELIKKAEPVAYFLPRHGIRVNCDIVPKEGEPEVPLHPQPKAMLTDEEIEEIHREFPSRIDLFARAIEQKIWEKNK